MEPMNEKVKGMGEFCTKCPRFKIVMTYDDVYDDMIALPSFIPLVIKGYCDNVSFIEHYKYEHSYQGMINAQKEKLFLDIPREKLREFMKTSFFEVKYDDIPQYLKKDIQKYVDSQVCPLRDDDKECAMYTERTVKKLNEPSE